MKISKLKKDLLESVTASQAGGSELNLFDEGGVSGFSVHLIYEVLTFSAAVCDSSTNVFDKNSEENANSFTKADHGLITGLKIQISTLSDLPSGLLAETDYYVIKINDDFFQLALSQENSFAGTAIELDDAGTGEQIITAVDVAGASITFQSSNDGIDFVDIQSETAITTSGSLMLSVNPVSYQYLKVVKAITAGAVSVKAVTVVIGD